MKNLIFTKGTIENGIIKTDLDVSEIASLVGEKNVIIIKELFPEDIIYKLRAGIKEWATENELVAVDDFMGNYHSKKVKVSNIQQTPHVFHDYNFNDLDKLPKKIAESLIAIFEPLRIFYNSLTLRNTPFGYIKNEPYFHPQVIQYPVGGGFFGRHNHNLLPQQIGFILSLSKYGRDYTSGGTCFVINDEVIDIEHCHDIGDLCLWPNDIDHWVKQSSLKDQFTWDYNTGRWVATFAYFNPY